MAKRFLSLILIVLLLTPQSTAARNEDVPARSKGATDRAAPLALSASHAAPHTVPGTPATLQDADSALRTRFEPSLFKKLLSAGDEPLRGIVMMREQVTPEQIRLAGLDRPSRISAMRQELQSVAERTQAEVRALLAADVDHQVQSYRPLWIVNGIAVEGLAGVFRTLALHPDVSIILEDHVQTLPDAEQHGPWLPADTQQAKEVQWNVQRIGVDRVWEDLDLRGEGLVVANMDTGVDWQHPYLQSRYRGYTGKPLAEHEGNWFCATDEGYAYPGDGHSHGTHTMGTMVGLNGIGVAPGARWIAAKIFDNYGAAFDSWIHAGFEWILAPGGDPALAPDVVNSSWGSSISASVKFLPDVQALRAAGIPMVFSAGNYGPASGTIASPSSYRESFAVGATDRQDRVARFSSRGPSPWDEIKPEVSAPGVDILSSLPGGGLGTKNGTSMAAPAVSGLIALMRQANATLSIEDIETILQETALPVGEPHPNHNYGWGLVDAYAAVTRAGDLGRLAGQVTDAGTGTPVAQAQVQAIAHGGTATVTARSDATGHYATGIGAGTYDVTVSAFGYAPETSYHVEISQALTTTLDATLSALPTGVLEGSVRETGTGAPLQATIRVPGAPPIATSDPSSGAYALVLPQGTYTVRAEAPAHRWVTATVTVPAGGVVQRDMWLDLAPRILLVDSGAWYSGSEIAYYEQALEDLRYLYDRHVIANVDLAPTDVPTVSTFLPYDVVVWSAPVDAPGYIGADAALALYLDGGGRLLLSGQDVAFWDGGGSGTYWAPYLESHLKARYVRDNAPSRALNGLGPLFDGITVTITGTEGAQNQAYPDVIAAADADYATPVLAYRGGGSGGQIAGPCLPYRALYLAFGFEGIDDAAARSQVLQRSIDWLTGPLQSMGIEILPGEMPRIERPGRTISHALRVRNTGEAGGDVIDLDLGAGSWPTVLVDPPPIALGACQSTTLSVQVTVPPTIGWHVYDTATLTARSTVSPGLTATASLVSKSPAPVLLVDGSRFYDVGEPYRNALGGAGVAYDEHRIKGVWPVASPTGEMLSTYPVVVWYTAYDWYEALSALEEARLAAYLDGGGRLLLSSQDYLYSGGVDSLLARHYLGVFGHQEGIETEQVWGETRHPIGWGLGPYTLTYGYPNWSDGLIPADDVQAVFRGQRHLPAALAHQGDGWRTTFAAFPLEALDAGATETAIDRSVGWLSWLGGSTWQADRRNVTGNSVVTMTGILRNDGWDDVAAAHFGATVPEGLSFIAGSLSTGATYHAPTQTVSWQGSLTRNETIAVRFAVQVGSLPPLTQVSFPAQLGYDDHHLDFERPYILRIDTPDLSGSSLTVEPSSSPVGRILTCTLTVRNDGLTDATAEVSATAPYQAAFTGTLDSSGIGSGDVVSTFLSWAGPVPAGGQVTLRYHLAPDDSSDYWLFHLAQVRDQTDERWYPQARAYVWSWKTYVPQVAKRGSP